MDISITRKSVTTEKEATEQINKPDETTKTRFGTITGTMGRKNTVPYALYKCHGFVNPYLAKDTGFTDHDLQLLWDALKGIMWEIDRSAARGLMCTRGLYVFEHDSKRQMKRDDEIEAGILVDLITAAYDERLNEGGHAQGCERARSALPSVRHER